MKKKLTAALAAGLMVLPFGTVNLTAEGAFNPNKDPNGDGILEIADAIYISQYLCGLFNPTDLSQLDVDDNDVVSIVDQIYVQMYEAGSITLRCGNEVSPDSINSFTTTNYLVYDAQNATYLRSYSLNVNDSNNTGGTRGIVGTTDDRITDWSNEGVAKIMTPSWYRGTGFVVDEHTIATAAHVVFNTTTDTPYEINNIYLFDSDSTEHSFTPVEYHIPLTYKNHNSYNTAKDYALITVEEDLSDYMTFKLGAITNSASTNNLSITSVGFPSEMYYGGAWHNGFNTETVHTKMMSTGSITSCSNDNFNFTADISGGNSGGPLYVTEYLNGNTYNTVVGITVAEPVQNGVNIGSNYAVRLNAETLKFFIGNSNKEY